MTRLRRWGVLATLAVWSVVADVTWAGGGEPTGACCITGGGIMGCFEFTEEACAANGGTYHGDGSICAPFLCNPTPQGACCIENPGTSVCFSAGEQDCGDQGGTFHGVGATCDDIECLPIPEPTGACCLFVDGIQPFCFDTSPSQCAAQAGDYQGDGTLCADNPCGGTPTPSGACCLPDESCGIFFAEGCAASGGVYQGDDTTCADVNCHAGPVGACCAPIPGTIILTCFEVSGSLCNSSPGTTYHGDGTVCTPDLCDVDPGPTGACCTTNGGNQVCAILTAAQCEAQAGEYGGDGSDCVPFDCGGGGGITITSANPPSYNPYVAGQQPFRDVLDTGDGAALTHGIGGAGTPAMGGMAYQPISVTFSAAPTPQPAPGNITITCTGADGAPCPTVLAVSGSGSGPYGILLSGVIPPTACLTLTFAGTAPDQKLQYVSLPGDLDMNGTTNTQDLLELVRALNNGAAALAENSARYNVNRDGSANTQDLLRMVQLLNGAQTMQPFNGASAADCP